MSVIDSGVQRLASKWWLLLVSGIFWFLFANVVLSFDFGSVWAIAVWTGFALVLAGCTDLALSRVATEHAWLHVLLGVLSIVGGIVALAWPSVTFVALASLVSWVLVFRGALSIALGLSARHDDDMWWLSMVLGVLDIVIGVWAAQYPGRSMVLLVLWVGVMAISKGIADILLAFRLRRLAHS